MVRNRIRLALGILLVAHFVWLASYVAPACASPDADGYFAQAQLIAEHGRVTFEAESPAQLLGDHWLEKPDGTYISRYPPGLSLLLAGAWKTLGRGAIFYVNPLLATLTILVLFLLCRPYVGERLALIGALVFAVNPLANYHSVHCDAHTASTFFLVTGLWLLTSWIRGGAWWRALAAGISLGYLPAVRYAEAAAAVGVALLIVLHWEKIKDRPRAIVLLLGGAAVPALLLALHNQAQFGAFWKTGYALTNEQQITWANFAANWHSYLSALLSSSLGPFFAFGLAGLAGMLVRRETRAIAIGLGGVIVAITAVYCGYYFNFGPAGASLRFLLPTLPLYVLPAMWLFSQIESRPVAVAAMGVLLAAHIAYSVPESRRELERQHRSSSLAATVIAWVEENIPPGSVIVCDRRVYQSINFLGKWKLADVTVALGGREPGARFEPMGGGDKDRPMPGQPGKGARLRAVYKGLDRKARSAAVMADLRRWAGAGSNIYWIGSGGQVQRFASDATVAFESVGEIEMPEPEEPGAPGGVMGRRLRRAMIQRMRRPLGGPMPSGGGAPLPGMEGGGVPFPPPGGAPPGGMMPGGRPRRGPGGGVFGFGAPSRLEVFRLEKR